MDVPSSGRPTPGRRLPVFSPCAHPSQVHIPFSNNETPSANALQRVETCLLLPSSRGQSTRGRFTIVRRSISRFTQTCRLPPVGGHVCCMDWRFDSTHHQQPRPNTLRRMSQEDVTPPRFSYTTRRPAENSSSIMMRNSSRT